MMVSRQHGSVLVYLIVLILIFGFLGVTMVSLFTTSMTSTAIPNDNRRCDNMAQSAGRYAFSELRPSNFSPSAFNRLNSTDYKLDNAGSFTINAFSPWFRSFSDQEFPSDNPFDFTVEQGKFPKGFDLSNTLEIINFEYTNPGLDGSTSPVESYSKTSDKTISIRALNDFNAAEGERVCLLFRPSHNHQVSDGGDLFLEYGGNNRLGPEDFLPRHYGSVNIHSIVHKIRFDYSYDRLVEEPENNRVRLTNLNVSRFRDPPHNFQFNMSTNDFVILSPRNYMIVPTGTSGPAVCEYEYKQGYGIYDYSREMEVLPDIDADEFTSNISQSETSQDFISTNTAADTLNVGGSVAPAGQAEFGAGWYAATKSIGGDNSFCQGGRCFFGLGIRVFFILKFVNGLQGDGLTFTLMNADSSLNDVNSIGGDFQLAELMGYAGDSRTADDNFLDPTDPRGIQPPKIAVEFDTRTNFDETFEAEPEPKDFCADASTLRADTRNDPLAGDTDAVQYVFWGESGLNVPCRSANPSADIDTYDDNRHGTTDPPINNRDLGLESKDDLDSSVEVDSPTDWLNGSTLKGPWAVRIEIEREEVTDGSGNFQNSIYTIKTWIRQCSTDPGSGICTDQSIIGFRNPFKNTRLKYDFSPVGSLPLRQQINLSETDHRAFDRFFFGFTGAAGTEELEAQISQFQLSFMRLGDSEVTTDLNWTP